MSDCCAPDVENSRQRRVLWLVLLLNALMFGVEFVAGWLAQSSGLLADSLDMLADALVYGVSLYAVGRALRLKAQAAMFSGVLQFSLGLLVLADVLKAVVLGSAPDSGLMMSMAALALLVNGICFALLYRDRQGDLNLQASWICSRNDMLANLGVMLSGYLVSLTQASWPDWLIGSLIAAVVLRSASRIIASASTQLKSAATTAVPQQRACCPGHGQRDKPH